MQRRWGRKQNAKASPVCPKKTERGNLGRSTAIGTWIHSILELVQRQVQTPLKKQNQNNLDESHYSKISRVVFLFHQFRAGHE